MLSGVHIKDITSQICQWVWSWHRQCGRKARNSSAGEQWSSLQNWQLLSFDSLKSTHVEFKSVHLHWDPTKITNYPPSPFSKPPFLQLLGGARTGSGSSTGGAAPDLVAGTGRWLFCFFLVAFSRWFFFFGGSQSWPCWQMHFQPQRHPAVSLPAGERGQEAEGPADPTKPGDWDLDFKMIRWRWLFLIRWTQRK